MKRIIVISSCFVVSLFLSLYYSLNRLQVLINVQTNGIDVSATVTSKECKNHGRLNYKFSVGNREVNGHSKFCGVPCDNVSAGDLISVRYYSNDPNFSECAPVVEKVEDVKESMYASIALIFLISTISGLAIVLKTIHKNPEPFSESKTDID